MEERLRRIQQALDERAASTESVLTSTSSTTNSTSSATLKRPADAQPDSANKRRQLPSTWKGASTTGKPAVVKLSQEQTHILNLVDQGQSVFYTGSAGTGKSVLLREIIKALKKRYAKSPDAVAVTASTGKFSRI